MTKEIGEFSVFRRRGYFDEFLLPIVSFASSSSDAVLLRRIMFVIFQISSTHIKAEPSYIDHHQVVGTLNPNS